MRRIGRVAFNVVSGTVALVLIVGAIAGATVRFDYAPLPDEAAILNPDRLPLGMAYDILGRALSADEARQLAATPGGDAALSPALGAVRVDPALARSGRDAFYRETFGNELFLTEVLGILDGGVSPVRLGQALLALGGAGTPDLSVTLAQDVRIGDRTWRAGESLQTGLAVPRGEYVPLGMRVFYDRGHIRIGFTCALCHARIDPVSGRVVEGAPNDRLRLGPLLALSANPAAMFPHTGVGSLAPYLTKPENMVRTTKGPSAVIPDPDALEADVRTMLAAWPAGSYDTTRDGANNPTSIPSLFVAGAGPYGWSGQAAVGPFGGLAAMAGDLHGFAVDPLARAASAPALYGVDPETYLATLTQRAPTAGFRFEPWDGRKPSEVLAEVDPDPSTPGLTSLAVKPTSPASDYVSLNGLVPARPDEPVGRAMHALAAFSLQLRPPDRVPPPADQLGRGGAVLERAGCTACHAGPAYTSHRVWPASVIGSEPSRAAGYSNTEAGAIRPRVFAPDTPFPPPRTAALLDVPIPDEGQLKLAWGYNRTGGGYKVASLIGLAWTAPYLHDGGVAVGPDEAREGGVAAIARSGHRPDPVNSLRALLDRAWRGGVVNANRADGPSRIARVTGTGHAFWVDADAGFTEADRDDLIAFLLSLDNRPERP